MPRSPEELLYTLQEATGLRREIVARLVKQAKPALRLFTEVVDDESDIPVGASKIGGLPDLPIGAEWPHRPAYANADKLAAERRKEAQRYLLEADQPNSWMTHEIGRLCHDEAMARADAVGHRFPLAFLAQIDLAALSRETGFDRALPHEGRLLLFYDFWNDPGAFEPAARDNFRLLWDRTPVSQLLRMAAPSELAALSSQHCACLFKAGSVLAQSVATLPPVSDKNWDAFDLSDEDAYCAYREWLSDIYDGENNGDAISHQLGGWPRPLQSSMQAMAQLASNGIYCGASDDYKTPEAQDLLKRAGEWRLVLQIGSDAKLQLMPGAGRIFILMRDADIAARRFDKAWLVYECD